MPEIHEFKCNTLWNFHTMCAWVIMWFFFSERDLQLRMDWILQVIKKVIFKLCDPFYIVYNFVGCLRKGKYGEIFTLLLHIECNWPQGFGRHHKNSVFLAIFLWLLASGFFSQLVLFSCCQTKYQINICNTSWRYFHLESKGESSKCI